MTKTTGVGACGKPALWFSKRRWAAVFAVHGRGSVHAVTDSRTMRENFHHLTGHYPSGQLTLTMRELK
jgi:hypothetical protein